MLSGLKRDKLKHEAIKLRRQGKTYPSIESTLGVSRSTLSGWFRDLELPKKAQKMIMARKQKNIQRARLLSVESYRIVREARKKAMKEKVRQDLSILPLTPLILEALLTMLYLGEGFKKSDTIGLGNSNPYILSAFVQLLRKIYKVSDIRLSCYLHLRADQDFEKEKKFWSKALRIPLSQFHRPQFDKRTFGKKTWKTYHGVCSVYCYESGLQKRLFALQEVLLEKILTGL